MTQANHIDADQIDALLPQTQCQKCGYAGCRPYAEAIRDGQADIDQCPPGGMETITALAELLDRPAKPLNPVHGPEMPPQVAFIDESACIGCVKCIQACPVDAIIGAARQMHTVIASECSGCELCLSPCPMDCISLVPLKSARDLTRAEKRARAERFRSRYRRRQARLTASDAAERADRQNDSRQPVTADSREEKRQYIRAAVARTLARRKTRTT